jgi:hypothetical protein
MFPRTEFIPEVKSRRESAEAINRAMARFPLILEILGELGRTQIPLKGDDDLRHGCDRTLTTVLAELAKIAPAPPGRSCKEVEAAQAWLRDEKVIRLIDADKLQRIQQFIDCILGTTRN